LKQMNPRGKYTSKGPFLPVTAVEESLKKELIKAQRRILTLKRNLSKMVEQGLDGRVITDYVASIRELETKLIEAEEELVCKDLEILRSQKNGHLAETTDDTQTIELHRENAVLADRLKMTKTQLESEQDRSTRLARTITRLRLHGASDEKHKDRINTLEEANVVLKTRGDEAGERVLALHRTIGDITKRFRDYVIKMEAAEQVASQRETEICTLTMRIAELRQENEGLLKPDELLKLREKFVNLENTIEFQKDERENLIQTLGRAQMDMAHTRTQLLKYKARLSETPAPGDVAERFARELKRAIVERDKVAVKLQEARLKENETDRIVSALESKLREITGRLTEYEQNAANQTGDMKLKTGAPIAMSIEDTTPSVVEFSRIKAERDELVTEHAEIETQLKQLRTELGNMMHEKSGQNKELSDLRSSLTASHKEILNKSQTLETLRSELDASRARYETLRYELDHTQHLIRGTGDKKQKVLSELIKKVEQEAELKLRLKLAQQDSRKSQEQMEKLEKKLKLLGKLIDKSTLEKELKQRRQTTA